MRWLDRLLKKEDLTVCYPAPQPLPFWVIDPKFTEIIPIASRSHPGFFFYVDLSKLHCTCPGFKRDRVAQNPRDVRRVCPHIYEAVKRAELENSAHPLMMLIGQFGRKFPEFHRTRNDAARAEIIFGFKPGSTTVGVYGLFNQFDPTHGLFDLTANAWTKAPAEKHDRVLTEAVRKVFYTRDRAKDKKDDGEE